MKKIEKIVDLSTSLEILEKIKAIESGKITSKELAQKHNIEINQIKRGIHFSLFHDSLIFHHDKWNFKDLKIRSNGMILKIPFLYLENKTGGVVKGKIPSFEYGEFDKEKVSFFRLALPIERKPNFIFSIENVLIDYNYKSKIHTRESTEVTIDNKRFLFFLAKENVRKWSDKDYLIIDSETSMKYSEFTEYCFSILISFGYISGDFVNNDGYFFQYHDIDKKQIIGLKYNRLRGSVKCQYVPIYTNPYGYIHDSKLSDLYNDKVRTLSLSEFSRLCDLCYSNDDIKTILLLLIEVHTQTLVSGPGILSIALETLANVIYVKNEHKIAPIKSKSLSKKIRKNLEKGLDTFKADMDNEGYEIIKSRIGQINQRTNRDKLLVPFRLLDIPITEVDIDAIEQRNAFLHGRNPMVLEIEPKTANEADKFRYYLYLKIYVLVSSIILKYIGYDNLVVNYPKIYEKNTGVELDEEYYRQI